MIKTFDMPIFWQVHYLPIISPVEIKLNSALNKNKQKFKNTNNRTSKNGCNF